jgi:hypothetical protein
MYFGLCENAGQAIYWVPLGSLNLSTSTRWNLVPSGRNAPGSSRKILGRINAIDSELPKPDLNSGGLSPSWYYAL